MTAPTIQFKRGLFANLPALAAGEPGFTTDKYDYYIGIGGTQVSENQFFGSGRYWTREDATNAAQLKLVDKDGANGVSLRAPATVNTPVTYTLPDGGGTVGYYLKLGNSGALEWASVSEGGSFTNATLTNTTLAGISTFSGAIDANAGANISGGTTLDELSVTGLSTFTGAIDANGALDVAGQSTLASVSVSGLSTFTGAVDANGGLDVSGGTTLDELSVTGLSTFTGAIDANGGLDVSGGEATFGSATVSDLTSGRVVLAGTSGSLEDSSNLTFGAGGLTVGAGGINVTGVSTFSTDVVVNGNLTPATFTLAGAAVTAILDEDLMTSDRADAIPTQQSVKAYVDTSISNVDVTIDTAADSGTGSVSTSETLTISGTANEIETSASGQTITVGLPDSVTVTTALTTPTVNATNLNANDGTTAITITDSTGAVATNGDLTVGGNLYVNGTTTEVNTSSLKVEDRTIDLGIVNGAAPSSDTTWDLGVLFNYYGGGAAKKSAVVWEHADTRFKFASVLSSDTEGSDADTPQLTVTTFAPIEVAELWVNNTCTGGSSQVIACSGDALVLQNITIDGGSF